MREWEKLRMVRKDGTLKNPFPYSLVGICNMNLFIYFIVN